MLTPGSKFGDGFSRDYNVEGSVVVNGEEIGVLVVQLLQNSE